MTTSTSGTRENNMSSDGTKHTTQGLNPRNVEVMPQEGHSEDMTELLALVEERLDATSRRLSLDCILVRQAQM